jgi:hypothetical protein
MSEYYESRYTIPEIPQEILNKILSETTILAGFRGSIAHGMWVPNTDPNSIDDIDLMGIIVPSLDHYFGLEEFGSRGTKETFIDQYDAVTYELKKFVSLLAKGNPNVLSLLWMPSAMYTHITCGGAMLLENRKQFMSMRIYPSFTGYAYGQLKKMTHGSTKGYMGAKRRELVEKFGYDCYEDASTEFLTKSGWKKFDDIYEEESLGTVDIKTGKLEWQKSSQRVDKEYSGYLYDINTYGSRITITENHNVLTSPCHRNRENGYSTSYEEDKSEWSITPLSQLLEGNRSHFHIRICPESNNTEYSSITDEFLTLCGLFLSDGTLNFRDKRVKSVNLSQVSVEKFFQLADSLIGHFNLKRYDYKKESVWIGHGEIAKEIYSFCGHAKKKHLPYFFSSLSTRQVEVFWEALIAGDGHIKPEGEVYYTSVKRLADEIHAMLTVAGIHAVVYGPYKQVTLFGESVQYHVYRPKNGEYVKVLNTGRLLFDGQTTKNSKDGYPVKQRKVSNCRVVCFTVPNGTLITRNKGKVAIQGNCKNAAHLIRLLRMGIEALQTGEMKVYRYEDAEELLEIKKGGWSLEEVQKEAERLFTQAEEAYRKTSLREKPDREFVNTLCIDIIKSTLRGTFS